MPLTISRRAVLIVAAVVSVVLLGVGVAMALTDEVVWTIGDFVIAAVLMGVFGLLLSVVLTHVHGARRLGLGALVCAGFALVYAQLAVGLI
ncbi:MAG: hypothetical protein AAGA84_04070 [Pseudomonadota bacterium]